LVINNDTLEPAKSTQQKTQKSFGQRSKVERLWTEQPVLGEGKEDGAAAGKIK